VPAPTTCAQHVLALADAEGAIRRLVLDGGVPPAVEVEHMRRLGQVQSCPARLDGEQEEWGAIITLEGFDQLAPLTHRRASMQHQARPVKYLRQEPRQRLGYLAELGEHQSFLLALGNLFRQLAQARELTARFGRVSIIAQPLRRMIAICLNRR